MRPSAWIQVFYVRATRQFHVRRLPATSVSRGFVFANSFVTMRGSVLLCLVLACLVALTAGRRHYHPYRGHRHPHHYNRGPKGDMPNVNFPIAMGPPPSFHLEKVANANRMFGVNLYKQLKSESGNIILSPFSVSAALAMTYAGAGGLTKAQMKSALMFNFSSACNVDLGFEYLLDAFAASKYSHTLKVVNRVFVESSLRLENSYKQVTRDNYGAEAVVVPFSSMPSLCRQLINGWVSSHTDGKIDNLLPPDSITSNTLLVLANAITFKGSWEHPFSDRLTGMARFHQSKTTHVKMMRMGSPQSLRYAYVSSLQSEVVELPFHKSRVAMYVVLPRRDLPLSYVEDRFSWNPNSLGLATRLLGVSLPKFTVKKSTKLKPLLKALGMKDLFDQNRADLSGMIKKQGPYVDNVYHQAYIDVHETGIEASAATAVVVAIRGLPEINFVANRPFLFFLWDTQTKSLLFNGRFVG